MSSVISGPSWFCLLEFLHVFKCMSHQSVLKYQVVGYLQTYIQLVAEVKQVQTFFPSSSWPFCVPLGEESFGIFWSPDFYHSLKFLIPVLLNMHLSFVSLTL